MKINKKNESTHTAEVSCESFDEKIMNSFSRLSGWFDENKREMPWREDPTPYHVWVSEIMLQQTRVDTVIPYYDRFINTLPDVQALAKCKEELLLKLWEGLGYYSRVRNMKKAAEMIMDVYHGEFPSSFDEILKLPGIGLYTAGAITSIAFHQKYPVVDGNVLRVVSRVLGARFDITKDQTRESYRTLLSDCLNKQEEDPGKINQALMELGAIRCLPNGKPLCETCPLKEICVSNINQLTDEIPVKPEKKKRKIENYMVLLLMKGDQFGMIKRPEKGLLSSMPGFPLLSFENLKQEKSELLLKYQVKEEEVQLLSKKTHIFTHVEWHMQPLFISVSEISEKLFMETYPDLQFVDREKIQTEVMLPTAFKIVLEGI